MPKDPRAEYSSSTRNRLRRRLITLSDFTGRKLEWTDSAGLRQVHRKDLSKEDIKSMIRRAYD
jgi:hypothetical protein